MADLEDAVTGRKKQNNFEKRVTREGKEKVKKTKWGKLKKLNEAKIKKKMNYDPELASGDEPKSSNKNLVSNTSLGRVTSNPQPPPQMMHPSSVPPGVHPPFAPVVHMNPQIPHMGPPGANMNAIYHPNPVNAIVYDPSKDPVSQI